MFLKQIRLNGFKSFATKTIINFESDFTGIVGPNGCGKSNIIDAIKWVLGEQSAKSMRGTSMSDVIFAGAEGKRGVNMAEVTLVFDNSAHLINCDYEEVEITRRLYKDTNESEYLINNTPCRLKDINDITLDTGLGKDSLSIISQGTIQQFAEAKPIERRALFEEAAGVAKYKKRKNESLSKLNRTQENIDRLNDILAELEKQVSPLKRQALKAQQYIEKKERLTSIEVAVLVNDIKNYNEDLQTTDNQLFNMDSKDATTKAAIVLAENQSNDLKDEINQIDIEVNSLQDQLLKVVNEIQTLEKRKVEVDEKRKYLSETGTTQQKIAETKKMLDDALFEYNDRFRRSQEMEASIEILSGNINDYTQKINRITDQLADLSNRSTRLTSRKSVLENMIKSPLENQVGPNTVLKNKSVLPGIHDILGNLITPDEGYEQMLTTALGASVYHIVTSDSEAAKNAIKFLKKNKSGNATFLPLNVLKARYVNKDQLFICENTEGFLGLASDFVDCDEKYDIVVLSLLGNVLVCDNIDHANDLARRINYSYKIVTLDGDVIYRGGTLSGGYNRRVDSPLTYQSQLVDVEKQLADVSLEISGSQNELTKITKLRSDLEQQRVSERVSLASLNSVVDIKKSKYEKLKEEYDRIKPDDGSEAGDYTDELVESLNKAYALKDEITLKIQSRRERRLEANNEQQRKSLQLRQLRDESNRITREINSINIEKAKLTANRENALERLARDYSMTYEYAEKQNYDVDLDSAKEEVLILRSEISSLGNVNLDAPEQFNEVNERYEQMNHQIADLTDARDKILAMIDEMDKVMTTQFTEMFEKINKALPEVFSVLFGGGKCKLILEDPDDILNTGIDIDVQPPGKNIQNIRLFSGGEKSLIAICVLFAILKARPIPLCIFDEVEAALDQGNVDRFARYIHNFKDQSQFIVVTHRPGTMTECDVLYGVTMQQKGVSTIMKVKLKEAIEYAEEVSEDGSVQ